MCAPPLRYPPADALDFATKFIAGKLSDYAAPKVNAGLEENMNRPDKSITPVQALAAVFPGLPHEVLIAVLEAANGSLEGAVGILLESGGSLADEDPAGGAGGGADGRRPAPARAEPPRPPPPPKPAALSALQQRRLEEEPEEEEDFVLSITVPPGSRPNALLKITTTIGTVHARVPPGVKPGQSFFVRMRKGSPYAAAT